ncbi:MAG: hypothetical protein ACXW4M_01835 [Anaerolineales bacterium]
MITASTIEQKVQVATKVYFSNQAPAAVLRGRRKAAVPEGCGGDYWVAPAPRTAQRAYMGTEQAGQISPSALSLHDTNEFEVDFHAEFVNDV